MVKPKPPTQKKIQITSSERHRVPDNLQKTRQTNRRIDKTYLKTRRVFGMETDKKNLVANSTQYWKFSV